MITVTDVLFKPTNKFSVIDIHGISFFETVQSPNVFVIVTKDKLQNNTTISFEFDGRKFTLNDIQIHKDSAEQIVECRSWMESII